MIRLLFWTAWFVLAGTALAHAGPVVAAIGAIFSAIASLGPIGQLIFGIALKVGASLIQRAMAKEPEQEVAGVKGQMQVGGDLPLAFIVGTYATPGSLEYVNTWGSANKTPNAYLTMVISLSDLPVSALRSRIWINGQACTIDFGNTSYEQGFPVEEYETDGDNNHLWVKFYDGTQTVADPFLLAKFGSDPDRPWQADMIGRGVAYAIVTAQVNRELFAGVPQFKFEIDGIKLYDVRKDSTAGGSGTQRWNDPSTWTFSSNPKVIAYNVIRGISYNGQWVYGGQNLSASRLPASSWMAAMNECDVLINKLGGGTEKQFVAGAELEADTEPLGMLEELDKACNGRTAEIGGFYKTHVGAPPLPVYAFTDEDIVITKGQSFEPFPGLENTFNGIQASYPEPAEAWANKDAPPRYNATFETADDGRRLIANASFPLVSSGTQVQRLMRSMIEDARRFREHEITLPPEAWLLEPIVDSVSWSSTRNGYVAKLFQIGAMLDHPNCLQGTSLKEVDPSDYDWSPSDELPSSVGFLGPIRPPSQLMAGWQVAPATIYDAENNARRPSIQVGYDGDLVDVRAVRVEVRLAASQTIIFDGEVPYGAPQPLKTVILNGTFLPNANYEVRGMFVPFSGRLSTWSTWLPVLTPDVRFGDGDIYDGVIGFDKLKEDVQEWQEWVGQGTREIIDELLEIATEASTQDLANFDDKQTLRRELVSTREGIEASYTEAIIAATGPGSALVQRIETLEITIPQLATVTAVDALTVRVTVNETGLVSQGSAITAIQNELPGKASVSAVTALDTRVTSAEGEITANANAITAIEATVNGISASANFRAEVYAGVAGYSSRIGLEARVGGAGAYRSASLFLDVPASSASPTRVAVVADQFITTDGTNNASPFVFAGGIARMNMANIGTVTAGVIRSPDSKFVITLSTGSLEWFD